MTATPPEDPHGPVLEKNAARQGRSGAPIVWVLVIGAVLAAIAMFSVWGMGADELAETEPHNARQASDVAGGSELRAPLQTEQAGSPSPDDGAPGAGQGGASSPSPQGAEAPPT